jgi:hypothetical protein
MAQSVHLICKRDDRGHLKGVSVEDKERHIHKSISWEIPLTEAEQLVGGWLYLHPSKSKLSEFGGRILKIEDSGLKDTHGKPELAVTFESRAEARNQTWRGEDYVRAWWGGFVDADLEHERLQVD